MLALLHWVLVVLGLTNAAGGWYLFWSGIGGRVLVPFTLALGFWRHHNCHVQGCWRIGRHPVGEHKVCRRHHPDDAPTHQQIIDAHRSSRGE